MRIIRKYFSALKLNHKFSLLIIGTIVIPMIVFTIILFQNMKNSQIKEQIKAMETSLTLDSNEIKNNIGTCRMSTQVIINNYRLWKSIINFSTNDVDALELMDFYNNDIVGYERLVNTNPYISQIRIFVDSDILQEMMPILYRKERMKRFSWAQDGNYESGSWQFDYRDDIIASYMSGIEDHMASLITIFNESSVGVNGVIEVATTMDLLFPEVYTTIEGQRSYFIDQDGKYYYNQENPNKWSMYLDSIFEDIPKSSMEKIYKQIYIDGEPVIVGYIPLEDLNGHLLKIVSMKKDFNSISTYRIIFIIGMIAIVIILILFVDKIVNIMFKQFYKIMDVVYKVQKGDLKVRIANQGNNEISELGTQFNEMLDQITRLMDVNLKKEMLAKDSEIRALQNQINAHFIYNVLESIKMMAEIDEKFEISNAVTALGKLLRYSMKWETEHVTIEKEIDYIKNYLALINLRFDYEILLSLNIPNNILKVRIPKMSLQPIIENAIYHGIEAMEQDTTIYLKGIMHDDIITIEITDAGIGMTNEQVKNLQKKIDGEIETTGNSGNGIGLKNVQDRLQLSFGEDFGISIFSKEGCYTKVILKIPMQ